jgi:hypothetical protein
VTEPYPKAWNAADGKRDAAAAFKSGGGKINIELLEPTSADTTNPAFGSLQN